MRVHQVNPIPRTMLGRVAKGMIIVAWWHLGILTALCLPIPWLSTEGQDGMTTQGIAIAVLLFVVGPTYLLSVILAALVLIVMARRSRFSAIRANVVAVVCLLASLMTVVGVYAFLG